MSEDIGKPKVPSESDVYDRQIRLWGAEAQSKMTSAKVLYVNISGVSSEIIKNLVLAGVSASIADGRPYPDAMIHTPSSFLSPSERTGTSACDKNGDEKEGKEEKESQQESAKKMKKMTVAQAMAPHVHELNPLLSACEVINDDIESIPDSVFTQFDIVIASKISLDQAKRIANACKGDGNDNNGGSGEDQVKEKKKTKFYLIHTFGFYACAMMDLGADHEFRKEIGKDKLSDLQKLESYKSLSDMVGVTLSDVKDRWHKNGPPAVYTKFRCILNYYDEKKEWPSEAKVDDFISVTKAFLTKEGLDDKYLGDDSELKVLGMTAMAEVSPVCAVIGGVLGNEVIKSISGKGEPANNILMFDGTDGGCRAFTLK